MKLEHEFTVPVPVDRAWGVLLDIERIAPCLPGAAIDSVTDEGFTGRVKVKVGPITVSYAGEGRFVEADQSTGHVVIEARGRETRGSGTAKATIAAQLAPHDGVTRVSVQTDLAITGKPAQFGRGVMVDIGEKLLGQFAACLADRLGETESTAGTEPMAGTEPATGDVPAVDPGPADEAAHAAPPTPPAAPPARTAPAAEPVPIDLLGTATGPVLKRLAPVAGVVLLLVFWLIRRRLRK